MAYLVYLLRELIGHHFGACFVALLYTSMLNPMCYVAEQRIKGRYLEVEAAVHGE